MAMDRIDMIGKLDMDILWLTLCLEVLPIAAQGVLQLHFAGRLSGRRPKGWHFAAYLFLLALIQWGFPALSGLSVSPPICSGIPLGRFAGTFARSFAGALTALFTGPLSEILAIGAELLAFYGVCRSALRIRPSTSLVAATLAVYIPQLSFGMVNSLEVMILPGLLGRPLLYLLLLLGTLLSLMICACCYRLALRLLSQKKEGQDPYTALLLLPGLFSFAVELYILQTAYRALPGGPTPEGAGKHLGLLLLQLLGLGALFCTLYAYRRICQGLQTEAALASLTQAAEAQRIYITEAQMRYGQTKAFRHDLKNHLAVLHGLLDSGKWEAAKDYLQKLDTVSTTLSFPFQTGAPIVDILLSEKLGMAKASGIDTDVSLLLPTPCGIDDLDLCVIFANALDNAIAACRSLQETALQTAAPQAAKPQTTNAQTIGYPAEDPAKIAPSIRITGERQGALYRLEFENTCPAGPLPAMGTGLSNIKTAAERYHGAMLIEKEGHRFRLDILLALSPPSG